MSRCSLRSTKETFLCEKIKTRTHISLDLVVRYVAFPIEVNHRFVHFTQLFSGKCFISRKKFLLLFAFCFVLVCFLFCCCFFGGEGGWGSECLNS